MKMSWLAKAFGVLLVGTMFINAPCGGSDDDGGGSGDIPGLVAKLTANPNDAEAKAALLQAVNDASASDLATHCMSVVNLAKSRIKLAPTEKPDKKQKQTKAYTELLLNLVASKAPSCKAEANFTTAMFKIGQAIGPITDLMGLIPEDGAEFDFTAVLGPVSSILSPELPCADGGLAQCGRDMADSVKSLEDGGGLSGTYKLEAVVVQAGDDAIDLSGTYNEATLRIIAGVGELVHGLFYFLAAHVDLNSILAEVTPLLSGLPDFDKLNTAGSILGLVDSLDGILISILSGGEKSGSAESLQKAEDSSVALFAWLNGSGGAKPAVVDALEKGTEAGLTVRLVDNNSNGRLDGCDDIQLNLTFISDLLSGLFSKEAESGCATPTAKSFQLPKTTDDAETINYDSLFSSAASALEKLRQALSNKNLALGVNDINPILKAVGTAEIADVVQIFPGVVFDAGLSFLTPASTGTGASTKLSIEVEVNENTAACHAKTAAGDEICKDSKGTDYSSVIKHGDTDHFGGSVSKDNISVSEALLDAQGAKADNFFRASQGGGIGPYLQLKNPDMKGLIKVTSSLLDEATDSTKTVCERKVGQTASGSFVETNTRLLGALINFALVQALACGTDSQLGTLVSGAGLDLSSGVSGATEGSSCGCAMIGRKSTADDLTASLPILLMAGWLVWRRKNRREGLSR